MIVLSFEASNRLEYLKNLTIDVVDPKLKVKILQDSRKRRMLKKITINLLCFKGIITCESLKKSFAVTSLRLQKRTLHRIFRSSLHLLYVWVGI